MPFFPVTQPALSCCMVKCLSFLHYLPGQSIIRIAVFQIPDMFAQSSRMFLLDISKITQVFVDPLLKIIARNSCVKLCVVVVVGFHCSPIHDRSFQTLPIYWTGLTPGTVTAPHLGLLCLVLPGQLAVVPGDGLGHAGHALVGYLHCVTVKQLTEGVIWGKGCV